MNNTEILKMNTVRGLKFRKIDLDNDHIDGGIYRLKNGSGEVIYVGKSTNLKRRLRQHLGKDTNTAYFIDEVEKADWFEEPDPVFQNLLEAVFISVHRPKYNDEVKEAKKKFGEKNDTPRQ